MANHTVSRNVYEKLPGPETGIRKRNPFGQRLNEQITSRDKTKIRFVRVKGNVVPPAIFSVLARVLR